MIITNKKTFEKVCKYMEKFCKPEDNNDRIYYNTFFIEDNLMCATNGVIMAIRNMSDCVINDEKFAFPCNIKPKKVVTTDGDKFIIESKKEEYFNKEKMLNINGFNWKKVIPTEKHIIEKEYDFSDYPKIIKEEKYTSFVIFKNNNDVVFEYNDDTELVVTYSDVVVNKENDMFYDCHDKDNVSDENKFRDVKFPMYQIKNILHENKNFILQEFDDSESAYPPCKIITKNYNFILMPCVL